MNANYLSEEVKERLQRIQTGDETTDLGRFPAFLVAGPQRTASTWLYYTLKRHPQVFLPVLKEVFYFSTLGQPNHDKFRFPLLSDYLEVMDESCWMRMKKSVQTLKTMQELYSPSIVGEVTPSYAALESEVIADIVAINPDIRTIITLRHPVERAISHATKDLVRTPKISASDVPDEKWERFFSTRGQLKLARYQNMVDTWTTHLKPGNLFLADFQQIKNAPKVILTAIHQFLGIRSGSKYCPESTRKQKNANPEVTLPDSVMAFLQDLLADEVKEYETLVDEVRSGNALR